jgi:hypothetical protein
VRPLSRYAHIWAPLLIVIALAGPSVPFLLPATQDHLDEIYQPLQALKFFKSKGKAYHKYAPLPNFILAPGYGASLAYWKVTGSFARPSEDFPYGFKRPFEQMGFLIGQGRVLFLLIAIGAFAYLGHTLRLITESRSAAGFAMLFTIATNWALVHSLPAPRPDSPMLAFSALALAVYIRILFLGLTARRGIWMSIWAVFAISSKELAGPMFVLPYLGLIALLWRDETRKRLGGDRAITAMVYCVATGVFGYALLNIVYAPATWKQRMDFWIGGPGIDADVWGGGSLRARAIGTLQCLLDNFGPGGAIVVAIAVIVFLVNRPPRWIMLLLPALSVAVLGLSRIQYPADRFFTILSLALCPVVAAGLGAAPLKWGRRWATGTFLVLGAVNLWFATFSVISLRANWQYVIEQHLREHVDKSQTVHMFNDFPWNAGSTRVAYLGYKHDDRSTGRIAAQRTNLPQWIYATSGKLAFLDDAKKLPARAAMIRKESGFDVSTWNGLEDLGYTLDQRFVPSTPSWFVFDWMPAVVEWKQRYSVLVYRLNPPPVTP